MSFDNKLNAVIEENAHLRDENRKLKQQCQRQSQNSCHLVLTSSFSVSRAMTLLKRYSTAQPLPSSSSTSQAPPRGSSAGDELDSLLANVSFDTHQQAPASYAKPAYSVTSSAKSNDSDDSLDSLLKGLSDQLSAPLPGYTQPRFAPAVPAPPPARHAHAPEPNPPAHELRIAPGRGRGGQPVVHKSVVPTNEHLDQQQRTWNKSNLPPQPGFNPVQGDVVKYNYIGRDQLEADLIFLKSLMQAGEIDNNTFQHQRDHMLIEARGGPAYGAQFSGSHPNVTGRAKGEEILCAYLRFIFFCLFVCL
jgi:hypothetical protein